MALTYFDVYADAYRRKVMTEGQLVTAVRLSRITLPQAREIVATEGKCGALWVPPVEEPTPTPEPTPEPTPTPPATEGAAAAEESASS